MKKRIVALAMAFAMVLGIAAVAAGGDKTISVTPMNMTINGQAVTPLKSDGTPAEVFAYEGATYAPVRYLSELLGLQVAGFPLGLVGGGHALGAEFIHAGVVVAPDVGVAGGGEEEAYGCGKSL